MKKLLLLLFLFLSFITKAQTVPPLTVCDDNNDGFAVFDLTSLIPTMTAQFFLPPNAVITFHESISDAQSDVNAIAVPGAYINIIPSTQTINIRIFKPDSNVTDFAIVDLIVNPTPSGSISGTTTVCQNSVNPVITITGTNGAPPYTFTYSVNGILQTVTTGISNTASISVPSATVGSFVYSLIGVQTSGFNGCSQNLSGTAVVTVDPIPVANPATLFTCDTELPIYDLNNASIQITGGNTNAIVTYYHTLAEAENQVNPIVNQIYTPIAGTNPEILYARVLNPSGVCFAITTLTMATITCGGCAPPANITLNNVSNTTFSVNWAPNMSVSTSILILPLGQNPSMPSAPPTSTEVPGNQYSYTVSGLATNACYSIYLKTNCSTTSQSEWSSPVNICMSDCQNTGTCAEVLILNAFLDSNNNGIKDLGENNFNYGNFVYQINDLGDNYFGYPNSGSYTLYENNPNNSYDISFAVNSELTSYFSCTTTYSNITLPDGSNATYLYFPVTRLQPHNDAAVYLYNSNLPRPGFTYTTVIAYSNRGFDTIANGTLTFTKDSILTISNVSQAGIVSTPTGFTYGFSNLAPNEYRYIYVTFTVPVIPNVTMGQILTNSASIQIANDADGSNNESINHQAIVGSYDPNDKNESHGGKIGLDNFTANDYLYYTIRFENTGTASTEFIRVEDVLDSQLEENSFEMLSASHTVNTTRSGSKLTWNFYNTQIPPTSIDPINSHGYIYFKIKPKTGYAVGDIIPNKASIYFDYNPPIVTNTHNTEFFQTLGNAGFNADAISMYPNPTSNLVTISNADATQKIAKIVIYEITGKRIYTLDDNLLNTISIDVSGFSSGIYLVELSSSDNSKIIKKLILK